MRACGGDCTGVRVRAPMRRLSNPSHSQGNSLHETYEYARLDLPAAADCSPRRGPRARVFTVVKICGILEVLDRTGLGNPRRKVWSWQASRTDRVRGVSSAGTHPQ